MGHDNPEPGLFIVIEGLDGAGSSTQSQMLVDWFNNTERSAVLTAEPTRGPVGVLLRQILSGRTIAREPDGTNKQVHNDVISLLFAADRMDHLDCEIDPHVSSGTTVVSDRYYHSSMLYQSLDGDLEWILILNSHARKPDVSYVLNLPADQAAQRRKVRGSEEIYETDSVQSRLVEGYRKLPDLLPDELVVALDGGLDAQTIHQQIVADLTKRFSLV